MSQAHIEDFIQSLIPIATEYGLSILGAILILLIGRSLAKYARKYTVRLLDKSGKIDSTIKPIIANIVGTAIMIVTIMAVLNQFGVETTSIVALLGAAGLAIGLALQGTLTNIASGFMLLITRPFSVGHAVKIAGQVYIVDEIGLFMSKLHTPENTRVYIPNSKVWGNEIHNYTESDPRRIDLTIGIGYNDDIDKAFAVIRDVLDNDERVLKDPAPLVAVGELADSSVNLLVRPWASNANFFATMLDVRKKIKLALDENGISIPFPQRDVHLFNQTPKN